MPIRPVRRALIAALVAVSLVVLIEGCTATKPPSTPGATKLDDPPKKEYQWKDMSTGRSFFRPIDPPSP